MMKRLLFFILSISFLFAEIEEFKVGTWNLQGSSSRTENKWNTSVRQLITGDNPVNILMVQEAGSLPSSARQTRRMIQPGGTPIQEFVWELGTRSRPRSVFIYYSDIDVGARRVNLAIISDRQADDVFVVHQDSVAAEASRPAIGIRIGTDAFFNIHALASGGGDANALVAAVDRAMNNPQNGVNQWIIAGDFNRSPANLQTAFTLQSDRARIVDPRSTTHAGSSGTDRTLDYAVVGRTNTGTSIPGIVALLMSASVRSYLASDHFPVRFGRF